MWKCENENAKKREKSEHQGWKDKISSPYITCWVCWVCAAPAYIDFHNNNKNYPLIIFHSYSYSVCIISLELNGNADFPLLFVEAMQVAQRHRRPATRQGFRLVLWQYAHNKLVIKIRRAYCKWTYKTGVDEAWLIYLCFVKRYSRFYPAIAVLCTFNIIICFVHNRVFDTQELGRLHGRDGPPWRAGCFCRTNIVFCVRCTSKILQYS